MFTLSNAEYIISLVLLILAYALSITINGVLQTWFADKMGDDTAKEAGYDSWNPIVHVDPIGFVALIIFKLGWPRFIPITPGNIYRQNFTLRLFLVHALEALIAFLLAFVAFILLLSFFDPQSIRFLIEIIFFRYNISLSVVTQVLNQYSSAAILGAIFLISFIMLNVFIAALSLILNGFRFALTALSEKGYSIRYADYILMFGPLLIIMLFADPLRGLFLWLIQKGANLVGQF